MQASNAPAKIPLPFANSGTKNTIPTASQIAITPGAASLTDGFPPLTRTPIAAGGVPPFGADMNGILFELSANVQWENAGAFFPYDGTFSTAIGGYPKGAVLLRTDGNGFWFSTTDNNVTNPDTGGAGWVALLAASNGASRVQGLRGANGATPATQMAWTADSVTLRNPTTGGTSTVAPAASITTDVSVAGPVANGRDQSAAFTTNTFVHFYYIWNGTTLSTISSPTAPGSGGPVLPTGYTNWAFASTVFWNGTTLAIVKVGGCKVSYVTDIAILSGGTATTPTAVSLASVIPSNGLRFTVGVLQLILAATGAGTFGSRLNLGYVSGSTAYTLGNNGQASAANNWISGDLGVEMINVGQQLFYSLVSVSGGTASVTLIVTDYIVANGDS